MTDDFTDVTLLDARVYPFEPRVSFNPQFHACVTTIVHPPFDSHQEASGRNYFGMEVEAQRQLKRVIAKLESQLIQALPARKRHVILTERAQMLIREFDFEIKSDLHEDFKFNLLKHISVMIFSVF